jgi:hypothetical protein
MIKIPTIRFFLKKVCHFLSYEGYFCHFGS